MIKRLISVFTVMLLTAAIGRPVFANADDVLKSAGLDISSTASSVPAPMAVVAKKTSSHTTSNSAVGGTLVVQPDDGRNPVINLINSAQSSIDVTIYTISDSQVVSALVAAAKKGVAVRVIYNYNSFAAKNIFPNDSAVQQIVAAGGQAQKASSNFTITHQKTITVDGTTSLIMTFNLSASYFTNTRDFGYITTDSTQVGEIENVFTADWSGSDITPSVDSLVWSPVNSRSKLLDLINNAQKTLIIDSEETSDKQCMTALINAAKRGVSVRFLTAVLSSNSTADSTSGGGTDGNAAERKVLNAAGVQAKGATNHYMHAKMMIADYGTSAQVGFLGSENFSSTSLDKNRELGVLLYDQTSLDRIDGIFESDWSANASNS